MLSVNQRHMLSDASFKMYPGILRGGWNDQSKAALVCSALSFLKVEAEDKFERIGGSSIGGGTFWGLGALLTKTQVHSVSFSVGDVCQTNLQPNALDSRRRDSMSCSSWPLRGSTQALTCWSKTSTEDRTGRWA